MPSIVEDMYVENIWSCHIKFEIKRGWLLKRLIVEVLKFTRERGAREPRLVQRTYPPILLRHVLLCSDTQVRTYSLIYASMRTGS